MPREHDAELSDAAALVDIERELRSALSLDPSAGFEARVLQRVANSATRRRPAWWSIAPLGAAAMSVVVATVALSVISSEPELPAVRGPRAALPLPPDPGPSPRVPPAIELTRGTDSPRGINRTVPSGRQAAREIANRTGAEAEPEVIVPPAQAEAVRRLVLAVAYGKLEPAALPDSVSGPPELLPIELLTVQPIVVTALDHGGGAPPVVRPQ